ncbi:MAG: hypothetical protein J6Z01_16670 [Bacteroidales bacterium]|nr:hypothetical protein [Bacteroidales bacterium]
MTGTLLRTPSPASAPYVNMLKTESDAVKLEVATFLLALVTEKTNQEKPVSKPQTLSKAERKRKLMALSGCWTDDPEDAARMEAAIKECREHDVLREVNMD